MVASDLHELGGVDLGRGVRVGCQRGGEQEGGEQRRGRAHGGSVYWNAARAWRCCGPGLHGNYVLPVGACQAGMTVAKVALLNLESGCFQIWELLQDRELWQSRWSYARPSCRTLAPATSTYAYWRKLLYSRSPIWCADVPRGIVGRSLPPVHH